MALRVWEIILLSLSALQAFLEKSTLFLDKSVPKSAFLEKAHQKTRYQKDFIEFRVFLARFFFKKVHLNIFTRYISSRCKQTLYAYIQKSKLQF